VVVSAQLNIGRINIGQDQTIRFIQRTCEIADQIVAVTPRPDIGVIPVLFGERVSPAEQRIAARFTNQDIVTPLPFDGIASAATVDVVPVTGAREVVVIVSPSPDGVCQDIVERPDNPVAELDDLDT